MAAGIAKTPAARYQSTISITTRSSFCLALRAKQMTRCHSPSANGSRMAALGDHAILSPRHSKCPEGTAVASTTAVKSWQPSLSAARPRSCCQPRVVSCTLLIFFVLVLVGCCFDGQLSTAIIVLYLKT